MSGQQHAGNYAKNDEQCQQPTGTVEQAVDRLQHHAQRLFKKDVPVPGHNRRRAGQDRTLSEILPNSHRFARLIEEGGYLGQLCQIRTKEVFGVGISNQAST